MKKAQKLVALLVVMAMIFSVVFTLAACNDPDPTPTPGPTGDYTVTYYTTAYGDFPVAISSETVNAGEKATGNSHKAFELNGDLKTINGTVFDIANTAITADINLYGNYTMIDGTWIDDSKNYTWRAAPSDLPTNWNVHDYETNSATYVLDYTSDALYTVDYNEDYTAYDIVPSMASGDPVDVTATYAGTYGIPADAVAGDGWAYSIPLKSNLKFDDGTSINANSFVTSVKNLLNPKALNFRADNLYSSGNLKIVGAESYVKGGTYGYSEFVSSNYGADEYVYPENITFGETLEEGKTDIVAQVTINGVKHDIVLNINDGGNWGSELALYASYGYLAQSSYATDKARNGWIIIENADGQIGTLEIAGTDDAPTYTFRDLEGNVVTVTLADDGTVAEAKNADGEALTAWVGAAPYVTSYIFDATLGQFKLFNAKGEYVAGRSVYADADGNYTYYDLEGKVIASDSEILTDASRKINNVDCYARLEAAADADGYVKLTESLLKDLQDSIAYLQVGVADVKVYASALESIGKDGDYAYVEYQEMAQLGKTFDVVAFDGTVGFLAPDADHIVVILIDPMEDNFYLRYELCTSFFLVNNNLYEQCEDTSGAAYTSTYGTSVNTYSGFGPYKLVEYVAGSKLKFERNPYWHGYSEIELLGQYQTTAVEYTVVKEDATRLEMFLKGEIDSYGLTAEDMDDYITSPYIYYQDSESTWFVAMNPQEANLLKTATTAKPVTAGNTVIKTPLVIDEFRQALSYSLDRTAFILACSPTSGIAKALLSSVMIADPEDGTPYRNTVEAQDAILEFWGLSDDWGDGKEYASRAEAIASITGYDLAGAKVLFTTAYNKAVESGFIPEDNNWELQICIGLPSTASFYTKGYAALTAGWTDAVKGTPWEGHLTFIQDTTLTSQTFADALHEGRVDLLFGVGYSGSMFDPYSFIECFVGSLQYDVFTDMTLELLDIEIDGSLVLDEDNNPLWEGKKVLRGSISEWIYSLQGKEFKAKVVVNGEATSETVTITAGTSAPSALRLLIMAKAETAVLNTGNLLPLMTDASASLRCQRIVYKTEDYILGVGRGGIQYYTYLMSDEEFAAFVAKQDGGVLNYKG